MRPDTRPITRRRALGILGAGAAALATYNFQGGVLLRGHERPRPLVPDAAAEQRLQAELDRLLTRAEVHEALVVVETRDGSWRWVGGRSSSADFDRSDLTADTPVLLASITKLYTAALVMRLVERGRLALDESIAGRLPAHYIDALHRRDGVDRSGSITPRNLLAHTSGLPDYFTDRPRGRMEHERAPAAGG